MSRYTLLAALLLGPVQPAAAANALNPEEVRRAAAKALPLIQKGSAGHMKQRTCFACHHQAPPILALTTARARGLAIEEDEIQKHLRFIRNFLDRNRDNYLKGRGQGGQVDTAGYALWTLATGGWKPDTTTAAVAEYLLLRDKDRDHWGAFHSDRPPSEASAFTTTYVAIRGLQAFGTPEQKARIDERLRAARAWLVKTPAADTEDRVFRLWGLHRAGAAKREVEAAARDLIKTQRPDGGWAQIAARESDAYATGTALVVLEQAAGLAVTDPVYQRGVRYLLATQLADGTWHVRSRSRPFQTYYESGFPHGKDQFISLAATGWATTALALALPSLKHEHLAHPGDPVKQEEHTALFDLVADCDSTHVAVKDGAWGDPTTWNKKAVPGAGARVVIPKDRTVTIAARHDKDRLDWVRVDGTLRFDPTRDTALKVVTLVGNVKSTIEIGTDKLRVQPDKSARLILGDRGERNDAQRERDPYDLSGGLLSHGSVRILGAVTTSHTIPTAVPKKGDTKVRFATAPTGWKVGDTLLFPGLDRQVRHRDQGIDPWTGFGMALGLHQDEERTIRALSTDGRTIALDRPLAYQHGGIYGYPEAVPVGNLSRNVVIESENTKDISRRGHVMFMHTQDVTIDSVLFRELGRTDANQGLTDPEVKDGKLVKGTDANSRGRYAVHFHIRWGATYKQQPFIVRNSAVVGSPKLGIVNHGGYGLVDDNVTYRVRGSHFFTENGSEIGRFKGNLAVRSLGSRFGEEAPPGPYGRRPRNFGHDGFGFWLEGGGVDVIDNVAIGHAAAAFGFFPQGIQGPQDPGNPLTRGTPVQRFDVFLTANLKDPRIAHGKPWIMTHAVPLHMARCVGLSSSAGINSVGIERSHRCVLHDQQDLIEDCRFVWNETACPLGYATGGQTFRNTQFIGTDPIKGRAFLPRYGIGPPNHVPGFLTLENVTIDGYEVGFWVPPRGINIIKGGTINGIRKVIVPHPWGGKLVVEGVKFGHTKDEEPQPILCTGDSSLLYAPEGVNWSRSFQPFEFIYNGRQVYLDIQKADHVPLDVTKWNDVYGRHWHHGPLDGKTNRQIWEQYRLAIGGRVAPASLTPCPDIRGGSFGARVPFDPPVESETSAAYYGTRGYEVEFGKASPDDVPLPPRYMFDPKGVHVPQKGYVAKVHIGGKEYQSAPTNLVQGVNLIPIKTGTLTRHVVVGGPVLQAAAKKAVRAQK